MIRYIYIYDGIVSRFEDGRSVENTNANDNWMCGCDGVFDRIGIEKVDEMILDRDIILVLDVGLFNFNCWIFINFFRNICILKYFVI